MTNPLLLLTLAPSAAQFHDARTGALIGTVGAGPQAISDQHFGDGTLTPIALERAIEWTEDRIQAARLQLSAGAGLATHAPEIRHLAELAGLQGPTLHLRIDAVEQLFSRLVLQAFGQSSPQDSLPYSPRVFASVVMLREMLHHLHFDGVAVEPPGLA
ncbi:MAG: hypothetical protein QE290_04685 [Acidovorax sp.]|uniref:hypothetical protein n=1 Tax=Acidovorax sp. TaxID=1872122 RepID=UPI0026388C05|nr:hypothetical protein [Acidovorax sp.]MDH4463316.1 hypothetical protein [Acidovorax sp.]